MKQGLEKALQTVRKPEGSFRNSLKFKALIGRADDDEETKCFKFLSRFVMREDVPLRKMYDFVLLVMLLYVAVVFPYLLAFVHFKLNPNRCGDDPEIGNSETLAIVDLVVSGFFWVDLFMNFLFTYRDHNDIEVVKFSLISRKYLMFTFWINLFACIPSDWFEPFIGLLQNMAPNPCPAGSAAEDGSRSAVNQSTRLLRLQRITRLARLARLVRVVRIMALIKKAAAFFNVLRGLRMFNMMFFLGWVIHIMACFIYMVASLHTYQDTTWVARRSVPTVIDDSGDVEFISLIEKDSIEQWAHAMYFVLTIFTTVGFGDMSAFTTGEIFAIAVVMIVGTIVHSMVMGEVINVVSEVDKDTVWRKERQNLIEAFGEHTRLKQETTDAMTDFIHGLNSRGSYDRSTMREFITSVTFPRDLLGQIPGQLFGGAIVRNKFVSICASGTTEKLVPPRFAFFLSTMLTSQHHVAQEILYQRHDHAFNVYLVLDGTFACVDEAEASQYTDEDEEEAKEEATQRLAALAPLPGVGIANFAKKSHEADNAKVIDLDVKERNRHYSSHVSGRATSSMLQQTQTAWTSASDDPKPWVRFDLGTMVPVVGLKLLGHPVKAEWPTQVKVLTSNVSIHGPWMMMPEHFPACSANNEVAEIRFADVVRTRFLMLEIWDWRGKAEAVRCSVRASVVVVDAKLYPFRLYGRDNFFGDEVLLGKTRRATVRCEIKGEVLMLHKSVLLDRGKGVPLMAEFPQFMSLLVSACRAREGHRQRAQASFKKAQAQREVFDMAAVTIQLWTRSFIGSHTRTMTSQDTNGKTESLRMWPKHEESMGLHHRKKTVHGANGASGSLGYQSGDFETRMLAMVQDLANEVRDMRSLMDSTRSYAPPVHNGSDARWTHSEGEVENDEPLVRGANAATDASL
jgi:CRP-like cAMP-binding protein